MKTSCQYPANEALIIIRKSQLDFCEGNACDAAVLSFLEYWHTIKSEHHHQAKGQNDIAEGHGDPRTQDETCWQFHTEQEIMEGIQCIRTSRSSIRGSIKRLEEKGILTTGRNPNPRYKFDRITWFLFHPEVMNEWLDNRSSNTEKTSSENEPRWSDGLPPSSAGKPAITEITSEITTEIPLEESETPEKQALTPSPPKNDGTDEASRLARMLADSITANYPQSRKATPAQVHQWAKDIDRLHRLDGKDWPLIEEILSFSQHDPFWMQNIQSGKKFREKWNQLLAKSHATNGRHGKEDVLDRLIREAQEREAHNGNGKRDFGDSATVETQFSRMG